VRRRGGAATAAGAVLAAALAVVGVVALLAGPPHGPPRASAGPGAAGAGGRSASGPTAPLAATVPADVAAGPGWVRSWQAATQPAPPGSVAARGLAGRTVRMRVHPSVGGGALRLTLSNLFGTRPLGVASVTVGLPRSGTGGSAAAAPGTLRTVTFDGSRAVRLPHGGQVRSDAVELVVPARADVLVSVALTGGRVPLTGHSTAVATSWLSVPGDHAGDDRGTPFTEQVGSWFVLTALDVRPGAGSAGPAGTGIGSGTGLPAALAGSTLVAFGDSITDGSGSTRDGPAGASRFERDVLDVPGVRTVVLLEGVNDIQQTPRVRAGDLVSGLRTLADRAHARGLTVVLATLTPYGGRSAWSPAGERVREQVNAWIRTGALAGGHADAVADLDATLRDPAVPTRLLPRYDCGDRIHPSDAGYAAVAETVEAALADALLEGARG
jgi:lysophospholipase L1-like esterase